MKMYVITIMENERSVQVADRCIASGLKFGHYIEKHKAFTPKNCNVFEELENLGYNLVIYYAGLQSMNIELLEASDIDGANWSQKIFSIVIPLLWPTTILNMILNLIGGFRAFDIVYVLTRGGPAHYSEVLASYLYYYSFSAGGPNKMGVGASVAFVIFACILTIAVARIIVSKRLRKDS